MSFTKPENEVQPAVVAAMILEILETGSASSAVPLMGGGKRDLFTGLVYKIIE